MLSVSVIIPAYNAGSYLRLTVLSALAQDVADLDVVVVDDGSTDDSVASVGDLPVRVVRKENGGDASARNAGVAAARGQLLAFMDSDDLFVSQSLATRVAYLEAHPACDVVGGLPASLVDEAGQVIAPVFEPMRQTLAFPFTLTFADYLAGRFFPVQQQLYLYRRSVFDRVGRYDERLLISDCDFHYRVLLATGIPILPIPVFDRRLHTSNGSLGPQGGTLVFKPELRRAIEALDAQYGIHTKGPVPWEAEYL